MLCLAVLMSLPTAAQQPREGGRRQFNPQEFVNRLHNFIREKASLSQEDADKVFPIYHEMKGKQMELNRKIMTLKRQAPDANAADKDIEATIDQIKSLNVQLAQVEQSYYAKMCKVIEARKVYKLMKAEDAFHREMLRKAAPGRGQHQGKNANKK